MNKKEKLESEIMQIQKGLKSDLEEKFKISLREVLKQKEKELAELKDEGKEEKKAEKKPSAPASEKKAEPKKDAKDILENCREILRKHKEQKAASRSRVEKRRKQGKPATLTPSETVRKTAQSVKSKVVDMKDKGLSAGEVTKLADGIVATIKSTLQGIKSTTDKHEFLGRIKKEISSIDSGLSKVAMHGGMYAKGGLTHIPMSDFFAKTVNGKRYKLVSQYFDENMGMAKRGADAYRYAGYDTILEKTDRGYALYASKSDEPKVTRSLFEEEEFEYEDGGMMARGGLTAIKNKYLKNEDENYHSENVVLLAKNFGTPEDLKEAKEILRKHEMEGSLSMENSRKRYELHEKLIKKAREVMSKEGIEFADGGAIAQLNQGLDSDFRFDINSENFAKGGNTKYINKKWRVVGVTTAGKRFEKVIELGRMSDETDVKNQLRRMYGYDHSPFKIMEVTKIEEIKADGGDIDQNGIKYALLHHISSGYIASVTSATTYQEVDRIRRNAMEILDRKGDMPYSVDNLVKILKEAEKDNRSVRSVGSTYYSDGGDLDDYYEKKKYSYEEGGNLDENTEMLLSQVKEIKHHAEEIHKLIDKNTKVESWVVAKAERSATDLSDITHYIDGKKASFADGGQVKWQDVNVGDSANVKSENKTGVIVKTYGRKFHLKFVDGSEKTYDANELEFITDEDDFEKGGVNRGAAWTLDHYQHNNAEDYEVPTSERKYAKGGVNRGAAWTLDHYQHNKAEDYEVPTSERKYEDGGAVRKDLFIGDVLKFADNQYQAVIGAKGWVNFKDLSTKRLITPINSLWDLIYKQGEKIRSYADFEKGGDVDDIDKLKDIVGEDYPKFVELLGENIKDKKFRSTVIELAKSKSVKYKTINVPCRNMKPTQNEISLDKSLAFPLTNTTYAEMYLSAKEPIRIKGNTILTCDNGHYIIDGHHRWSQVFVLNPDAKMACTDFYQLKKPILGLKATQIGIAADLGYVPTQNVNDINLLTTNESELKEYVNNKITDDVRDVFKKHGIENPAEHIWQNVKLLKTHNKPIKGASKRDFMPQTDDASNFAEYTPNLSKLEDGGCVLGEDTVGRVEDPRFADVSAYARGGAMSMPKMSASEFLKKTVVFDDGNEVFDRYTVFTPDGSVFGMSYDGKGFNQYVGDADMIEMGEHLGKRLLSVPEDIKDAVLEKMEYMYGGKMAMGGMTEHGLRDGDKIMKHYKNVAVVSNGGKTYVVHLPTGKRYLDSEWSSMSREKMMELYKMADGGIMAKGGSMADDAVEISGLGKNIMGTLDITIRLKSMRKPQKFSVYPVSMGDKEIMIQSDTRIGRINMSDGTGKMSQSHPNGAYGVHFSIDKLVPFKLTDSQLSELKSELAKTAGKEVGNKGVISNNEGAAQFMAKGGSMADDNMKLTKLEKQLLEEVIANYDEDDNMCFTRKLSQQEKGVMSSLVKKGLVYDSFEGEEGIGYDSHNYFPAGMAMGGKVKFSDKVKSISQSLLKRKKVSPSVKKDYGKTYSKKEAVESAKRIAGAMRKKELAKKKR